jgi:DNA-3-methyladenine glycosylase II
MEAIIYPKAPFDFPRMLRRHQSTGKNKLAVVNLEEGSYRRLVRLGKRVVLLDVINCGTIHEPKLLVKIPDILSEKERTEVLELVRLTFSTELDLSDFYRQCSKQAEMEAILRKYYGLRIILEPDLFETMVKTIISQQLNLAFAATLIDRLVSLAGEKAEVDGVEYSLFPTAEQVAALSYEQLRACSYSQRKAEYVIDFARGVADGRIDLKRLWSLSDDEIMIRLLPIRGVGRWTVECLMMFGMGRTDLLPAADIGLRNAVKKAWGLPYQPTEQEIRQLGADWSPWRSYATYYLWESLTEKDT